ncbi:MAG: hypothetical protein HYR58_02025 [Acidobacteria bacterium]|nr:hypothetical protein [Acidobacteriota bacterium]
MLSDPVPLNSGKDLTVQETAFLRSNIAGLQLDPLRCVLNSEQELGA